MSVDYMEVMQDLHRRRKEKADCYARKLAELDALIELTRKLADPPLTTTDE